MNDDANFPNSYITPKLDELGSRLERIEDKLDNHLQRVSKAEQDIEWMRGGMKLAVITFLGILGGIGTYIMKHVNLTNLFR